MAKNGKQIWMTILIALVVGILSSAITASIVSKNVLLGPTVPPKEIRANSCNADDTCEINKAIVLSSLGVFGNFAGNSVDIASLRINQLQDEGTSYACISPSGSIVRSDEPCR